MRAYHCQDENGTDITVRRTKRRAMLTVNDGWHDVSVELPSREIARLAAFLRPQAKDGNK